MLRAIVLCGLVLSGPVAAHARADESWLLFTDVPGALPLSAPQSERFGPGVMPSVGIFRTLGPFALAGLRARAGILSDGKAPASPGLRDPAAGGWLGAMLSARVRPVADVDDASRATGPWLEISGGAGLTGDLFRPAFDVGAGYQFRAGRLTLGPTLRYMQVIQPAGGFDVRDARLALLGIEIDFFDPRAAPPAPPPPAPPPPPPPPPPPTPVVPRDSDGDGLLDPDDRCPQEPEDKDGVEDADGCPEDNDRDGIADADDKCPNEAEVVNGIDDQDGCPDAGDIEMIENRVVLDEAVLFDVNRARVKSGGRRALTAIVALWRQHPEWERMAVEGHASVDGPEDFNQSLSEDRAQHAAEVLIELGFAKDKVTWSGLGSRRPRDLRTNADAHARNRRVEFVIIDKKAADGKIEVPK